MHHVDFRSKTIYNYLRSKYLNMSLDKKNNMKGKFEYLVKFYKRTDEIVFAEGKVIPN